MPMTPLLNQIQNATHHGFYMLGLYSALSLPDICGALESNGGRASGARYKKWFDDWVAHKYLGNFSGEQCYAFRCGIVHQGRAAHTNLGFSRILFVEPGHGAMLHNNIMNDALNIDVGVFCQDLVDSVREWEKPAAKTNNYSRNITKLLQRHTNGLSPYIRGIPVYS